MKTIKPVRIFPETVDVYHDEEGYLGTVNEYEFNQFRIDIMSEYRGNKCVTPYYVLRDDIQYHIDYSGRLEKWAFFDTIENQLRQLLRG